jgi:hypothetical protein
MKKLEAMAIPSPDKLKTLYWEDYKSVPCPSPPPPPQRPPIAHVSMSDPCIIL